MSTDLDTILGEEVILRYPSGITPAHITHTYTERRHNREGEQIPFDQIVALLRDLRIDVERWYEKTYHQPMDTYALGERTGSVQQKFWEDSRFKKAFSLLELDHQDHEKAPIPWWNEVAAGEIEHKLYDKNLVNIVFGPRHSLETQLMRNGVPRPVKNVSVAGIIITSEAEKPDYMVIGVRGGATFPNTYHVNAGALMATPAFKKGLQTVYDIFRQKELLPEFGITDENIISAHLNSRIYDHVIDKGPMYTFAVKISMSKERLHERWHAHLHPDKAEHDQPVYIHDTPEDIRSFIHQQYRGVVANRKRTDDERYLLHPGALVLAAYSGMSCAELKGLFKEGTW